MPGSADNPAGPADSPTDPPEVDYWQQVGDFVQMWESHVKQWPEAPGQGERDRRRPTDPSGSWRGEGGRYLSPEQNADADRLIASLREPEQEVTALMQAIERDNAYGGKLVGLEHRIKGTSRLKEKIADKMKKELGSDLDNVVSQICDAIRYTFRFEGDDYRSGHRGICKQLESVGCRIIHSEDHWFDDLDYKGINTRWVTSAGGRFELQFHTRESFHAKEHLTHDAYSRLRSPDTSRAERRELEYFQRKVSGTVPTPPRI